jgi:hypothetical protein
VPGNESIGDIVEVVADDLRLRAYSQDVVSDTLDQCRLPAGRDRADGVPCVAGDKQNRDGSAPSSFSTWR